MNLPEIILCDYGTAGPDGSVYPGTNYYMPYSAWTSDIDLDNLYMYIDTANFETDVHTRSRENGIANDVYAIGIVLLEFFVGMEIYVWDSSRPIGVNWGFIDFFTNEPINEQRYKFYDAKCPELVKLMKDCLQKEPEKREQVFYDFQKSAYFQKLQEDLFEIRKSVKCFFDIIPDKDDEQGNFIYNDSKSNSWCDRILKTLYPRVDDAEIQGILLLKHYNTQIKPYFTEKANEYFKKELMKFL